MEGENNTNDIKLGLESYSDEEILSLIKMYYLEWENTNEKCFKDLSPYQHVVCAIANNLDDEDVFNFSPEDADRVEELFNVFMTKRSVPFFGD